MQIGGGGDSLDPLSLQDFQGSASEEKEEEGSAAEEEEQRIIRDGVVALMKMNAELERSMAELKEKWTPRRWEGICY